MNMNRFDKLTKNIIEMLTEQQLKLGFMKETVRLYYPLKSLNRFLNTNLDEAMMIKELEHFADDIKPRIGQIDISNEEERFCFACGPDVSVYVKEHMEDAKFLRELIDAVSVHGTTIQDIYNLFLKYSEHVYIEYNVTDEFDALIYFEDKTPDDFWYCISDEGCHVIYHRFTKEDYLDIYG